MDPVTCVSKYFFSACLAVLFACSSTTEDVERYVHISDAQWHRDSVGAFGFTSAENEAHGITVLLRLNNDYAFRNCFLFITLKDSLGHGLLTDTVMLNVADKTGKWLGSGLGETKSLEHALPQFSGEYPRGRYTIALSHGMRQNPLQGVVDIGIRMSTTNDE